MDEHTHPDSPVGHDGHAIIDLRQGEGSQMSWPEAGRIALGIGNLIAIDFGTHGIGALPITRFDVAPGGGSAAIILGGSEADATAQRMHQLREECRVKGSELAESRKQVKNLSDQVQNQIATIGQMARDKEELRRRLADAESTHEIVTPTVWRQGSKVKQNVYAGDDPVAQFHDTEDARLVVEAVNAYVQGQGWDKNITINVNISKENTE